MTVGFSVANDGNHIVIDSTYSNLALVGSGTTTTNTVALNFSYRQITVSGLTSQPMVAVSSTAGAWATVTQFSGGTATIDIVARGAVGVSVKYWLFGTPPASSVNYGLRIRNAAGAVVFDAANKYMRIVGTLVPDAMGTVIPAPSLTLPTGRTYASMQQSVVAYGRAINTGSAAQPLWILISFRACLAINSNVITNVRDEIQEEAHGGVAPNEYVAGSQSLIVDVTGY